MDLTYLLLLSLYPLETMYDIFVENVLDSPANRDREMLFKFGLDHQPLVIEEVGELTNIQNEATQSNYQHTTMINNFTQNMVQLVETYPETEFIFFYPPYAIFWHVRAEKQNKGYAEEITKTKISIYEELSSYENVKVYDFQERTEITHKINNYFDIAHYFPSINEWIVETIQSDNSITSIEEAQSKAYLLHDQIVNYDERKLIEN